MATNKPAETAKPAARSPAFPAPPETLTDGDLVLRKWRQSDAAALGAAASASLPELQRWMPWAKDGYGQAQAEAFLKFCDADWISGENYNYAVIVDGRPCGSFGIMAPTSKKEHALELGYWLATEVTGRGLATRACVLLTRTAFDMGAQHVQIRHNEQNSRSAAVPKRLGFTCLGAGHGCAPAGDVIWQVDRPDDKEKKTP